MQTYYSVPAAPQPASRSGLPNVAIPALLVAGLILTITALPHVTNALYTSPAVVRPLSVPGNAMTQPFRQNTVLGVAEEPSDIPEAIPAAHPRLAPLVATTLATSLAVATPALASPAASVAASVISLLVTALNFYQFALFVRIILTWLPVDPYQPPLNYLSRITDPLLNSTRGLIPPIFGLDFGPTLVLIALNYCTSTLQAASYQLLFF
eukprot:EG_transcript_20950